MHVRWMRRRDFTVFIGIATSAWPFVAGAQKSKGGRRVGVLMNLDADDPEGQARAAAFHQALLQRGWAEGGALQIDYRWGAGDGERYRRYAQELGALMPDVLLAGGGQAVEPLRQSNGNVPIVFTNTNDPIALGFVASLSRPGGNITGVINVEYDFGEKWLALLKLVMPSVARAAVIADSSVPTGRAQYRKIEDAAPSFKVQLKLIEARDPDNMEKAIREFAGEANSGLIVTASTLATLHRGLILSLASRYRLPAVYPNRLYVVAGGLISYGPDFLEQYRRAAYFVDRILNGAKPTDLPVEAPRIFETVVNIRTARDLGLKLRREVLLQADEQID